MKTCARLLVPLVGCLLVSLTYGAVSDPLPISTTPVDPETTTAAPTTTPATTTTTTTTTTTPVPPTTTPAPVAPTTPAPAVVGTWNVTDTKANVTCVMVKMAMQIAVQYTQTDNKNATALVNVPVEATASGVCGNASQSITIAWSKTEQVLIEFALNSTTKSYHVSKMSVSVDSTNFPNAAAKGVMTLDVIDTLPTAPVAMSYRCTPVETIKLAGNSSLYVSELQIQAFHVASDDKFGAASDCQAGDTADIVPIVVGCALAGLVLIVLVAYLVGRRRSRQSGYLSM